MHPRAHRRQFHRFGGAEHALTLAQALGSSLQLLYVVDVRRLLAEVTDCATPDRLIQAWRVHGEQMVSAAAETIRACGVEVDATVRADPTLRVSDQIVDEARRIGAGLIVMGTPAGAACAA